MVCDKIILILKNNITKVIIFLILCLSFSLAPIQFQWECETSPNIVEIKPPMGVIGPGEIADLEVTVTGLECGPLACDLLCRIEHQEKPIRLNVVANIEGPTVAVGKF